MGDYLSGPPGVRPVGSGAPTTVRTFVAQIPVPNVLLAVGRIKLTVAVPGIKVGDNLLPTLAAPLPGNLTLSGVVASAANVVDFYIQNTVALALGNGGSFKVTLLVFR